MDKVKVGIVGCGAVTQLRYLPATRYLPGTIEVRYLVDISENRARDCIKRYAVPH